MLSYAEESGKSKPLIISGGGLKSKPLTISAPAVVESTASLEPLKKSGLE